MRKKVLKKKINYPDTRKKWSVRKRVISYFGYVKIYDPSHPMAEKNGYVQEHRKVAYDAGILKDREMNVHHKNGIKDDNRLSNLEVLTRSYHTRITWLGTKKKPRTEEEKRKISESLKRYYKSRSIIK